MSGRTEGRAWGRARVWGGSGRSGHRRWAGSAVPGPPRALHVESSESRGLGGLALLSRGAARGRRVSHTGRGSPDLPPQAGPGPTAKAARAFRNIYFEVDTDANVESLRSPLPPSTLPEPRWSDRFRHGSERRTSDLWIAQYFSPQNKDS